MGKIMTPIQFRYMLVAYLSLGIFGGIFDFLFPSAIPETLANAQNAHDADLPSALIISAGILGVIILFCGIIVTFGLYMFRPWAPRLALVVTLLALPIYPLLGFQVASGWSMAITDLATTMWGAILALAYFSPLKERFFVVR
jgi:hypothetical protein